MATALTTLANVKDWLRIVDTSADATLTRMITAFSNAVANYLNRDLGSQSYTEIYDGTGGTALMLRNYPIISVSSVQVGDTVIPAQPGFNQNGYVAGKNRLLLIGYSFDQGFQNIATTYTAGFATIPTDVEQAIIEWIADRYAARNRIGINSKSLQGENVTYSLKDIPDAAQLALAPYRKVFPSQ